MDSLIRNYTRFLDIINDAEDVSNGLPKAPKKVKNIMFKEGLFNKLSEI